MKDARTKRWWRDRFVTLMVIPERTRRVHRVIVPFFLLKLGLILVSLSTIFLFVAGIDYIHVLGQMAENKRLKGENFKLRQEVQLIRNKVDAMETTLDRVRNYAKKLQILTGQTDDAGNEVPWGPMDKGDSDRVPASHPRKKEKQSRATPVPTPTPDLDTTGVLATANLSLTDRVDKLSSISLRTEANLSRLQVFLLARSAIMAATPSLIPIPGYVSSTFGYRRHPYDGVYRLHAGIDLAAEPGTPVRAPADGFVIFSGYKEGYGKVIVIDHGYQIRTLFAHNSALFVNQGTHVKRGEMISQVGSTGMSTGPHLHYEVRKNGVPVNPATFFSRTRF